MSVKWKENSFQLIMTIIGSGLLIFVITSIAADLNKPLVDLSIDDKSRTVIDEGNGSRSSVFMIHTYNYGKSAATGLWLAVVAAERYESGFPVLDTDSNYVNIRRFEPIISTENMSKKKEGLGWTVYIPNLSPGTGIDIAAYVDDPVPTDERTLEESLGQQSYMNEENSYLLYASVSYDQGTAVSSNIEGRIFVGGTIFHNLISGSVPSTYISMIGASALSVIAFGVAIRFKKLKEIRERRALDARATTMLGEIIVVKEELAKEPLSKKYIPYHLSNDMASMYQIFNNYEDYSLVKDFYDSLDERRTYFSSLSPVTEMVRDLNRICFEKANAVLSLGTWTRYLQSKAIRLDLVFAIPAIVISSIFIYYVGESLPAFLFYNRLQPIIHDLFGITSLLTFITSILFTVIFSFTLRTTIAYLLARTIVNKFQYISLPGMRREIIRFSRHELIQMFFFSATIMGFPIVMLSQTFEATSLFGNSLFPLLLFFEVVRMYILTVYVPNTILMKRSRYLFVKVLFIPIAGFLLYFGTLLDEMP
jgi:hypothetical protein